MRTELEGPSRPPWEGGHEPRLRFRGDHAKHLGKHDCDLFEEWKGMQYSEGTASQEKGSLEETRMIIPWGFVSTVSSGNIAFGCNKT